MTSWVRCCRTILDWDDQPIPMGILGDESVDPLLIHYCGRVEAARAYADDELAEALEEPWSCPCCGGSEYRCRMRRRESPPRHGCSLGRVRRR